MALRRPVQLLLLAAAVLFPTVASALDETYEGMLEPELRETKIPIVVKLKGLGVTLQGSVNTEAPYKGSGPVDDGENSFGFCTIAAQLSETLALRMSGPCDAISYSGTYSLVDTQKRIRKSGTFDLPRKAQEAATADATRGSATPASCLKANTQCLIACPRDDEAAAFMCSNHCRTRLKTCKAQTKKTASVLPGAD